MLYYFKKEVYFSKGEPVDVHEYGALREQTRDTDRKNSLTHSWKNFQGGGHFFYRLI